MTPSGQQVFRDNLAWPVYSCPVGDCLRNNQPVLCEISNRFHQVCSSENSSQGFAMIDSFQVSNFLRCRLFMGGLSHSRFSRGVQGVFGFQPCAFPELLWLRILRFGT